MSGRAETTGRSRLQSAIDLATSVLTMAAALGILWAVFLRPAPATARDSRRPALQPPADPIALEGAASKGNPKARVGLVMYSDFQCPFCRTFARDVLPALERKYVDAGRLLLAFRHLPSRQLHPQAIAAAQLAECARRLDRFWPVHDQIFSLPREFDETALRAVARKAGVDPDVTEACRADQLSKAVTSDLDTARTLGIRGTPTVMIGLLEDNLKVRVTRLFVGARPVEEFEQAIDAVLLQSSKAN